MTPKRLLLATFLILWSWHPSVAQDSWKPVDSFSYDWKGDGKPYRFVMDIPSDYDGGGDFTRLRIERAGRLLCTVQDEDGIDRYLHEANGMNEAVIGKLDSSNPTRSPHLLFTPSVRGSSTHPLLFLFGWGYASSPGSLHIVALGGDGVPKEVLRLRNFLLTELADTNGDGKPEIVGKPCLSQSFGDGLVTYDPYHIYTFGASATSLARLDVALSKKFNLAHYYGWAGMDCREDVAVVLHPPGGRKPVIMKTKEAEKLSRR